MEFPRDVRRLEMIHLAIRAIDSKLTELKYGELVVREGQRNLYMDKRICGVSLGLMCSMKYIWV
jgi:hypothetical protein